MPHADSPYVLTAQIYGGNVMWLHPIRTSMLFAFVWITKPPYLKRVSVYHFGVVPVKKSSRSTFLHRWPDHSYVNKAQLPVISISNWVHIGVEILVLIISWRSSLSFSPYKDSRNIWTGIYTSASTKFGSFVHKISIWPYGKFAAYTTPLWYKNLTLIQGSILNWLASITKWAPCIGDCYACACHNVFED